MDSNKGVVGAEDGLVVVESETVKDNGEAGWRWAWFGLDGADLVVVLLWVRVRDKGEMEMGLG